MERNQRQSTGIKSPGMKIIPMMVVLICASGGWRHGPSLWKASALEVPIPGLGRVKVEFHADRTSENPSVGSTITDGKSEPTEALTTATEVKDQPDVTTGEEHKEIPSVPKDNVQQQPQTTSEASPPNDNSKSTTTEFSDPDDFDDSDIWDDTEDPPKEFGREYDLDPSLLDAGGNDLGDFQPKLPLPPNLMKDMFFESPAEKKVSDQDDASEDGGGIFERIKRIFSITNIKEQLDTIPGKVQDLMDGFRQKKSEGLKQLRQKMDGCAEKVGQNIAEAFSKLKGPQETPEECVTQLEQLFKQYEAALQGGLQPCMNKIQRATSKQDSVLRNAQAKFTGILTDMQDCVNKLDSSGLNSLVKSLLNVGSCTKKNIQSKIADSLQPHMKRLSELVQQQRFKLDGTMNATGLCVERQLQLPKFQKMQQELIAKGKQCLEKGY